MSDQDIEAISRDISELAEDTYRVGRIWARHGLQIGKAALETSAMTLQIVARNLDRLSETLPREPSR